MKLMNFNESEIADRINARSIEDVLNFVPFSDEWDNCDGRYINARLSVCALVDNNWIDLKKSTHIGYAAAYSRDYDSDADSVGIQIAGKNASALILTYQIDTQNEQIDISEYLQISPIDWGKLRRRVEDTLRKTQDQSILFDLAQKLNCKIY